jgi:hypothetical protein
VFGICVFNREECLGALRLQQGTTWPDFTYLIGLSSTGTLLHNGSRTTFRPAGTFSGTAISAVLRSNTNPSLRALAIVGGRESHDRGWSHPERCVRTGGQALDQIYGAHVFEFLTQHPEERQIFHDAMTGLLMIDRPAVAAAYSFDGIRSFGLLLFVVASFNSCSRAFLR